MAELFFLSCAVDNDAIADMKEGHRNRQVVHAELSLLLVVDLNFVTGESHFWKSRVHKAEQHCNETSVVEVAIFIHDKEVNRKVPHEFPLHNAQALAVDGPTVLENSIYLLLDLDALL